MADNTPITPGSGASVATDAATYSGDSGVHVQLFRPVGISGSEGSKTVVDTPVREPARLAVQTSSLTTSTTLYTAGDQVGTLLELANAARAAGGFGVITSALLTSAADNIGPFDLVLFRASGASLASDNAAFSISAADTRKVVAVIPLAQALDLGSGRIAQALNIAVPYDCSGGTSLYAALITRSTLASHFAAGTDLELVLQVERA